MAASIAESTLKPTMLALLSLPDTLPLWTSRQMVA